MNTLLVNSSYPPPTQSPFTNQSCLAQFEAVPFICPADIGLASAANFSHLHLGSSWGVSALSKRFVPSKRQVSLCRKSGSAWVCEFFIDNNYSQRKYSIIRRKKFVNMPEIKQIMNEFCVQYYISLYAVICCCLVLSRTKKFWCHNLQPLSMVEMNGKPPLTGAGGCALSVIKV